MTINYTWKVDSLEREIEDGYVHAVNLTVSAETESNGKTYNANVSGRIQLARPETLVPYEELTESMVIGWVKEKQTPAGVADTEGILAAQLEKEINSQSSEGTPW